MKKTSFRPEYKKTMRGASGFAAALAFAAALFSFLAAPLDASAAELAGRSFSICGDSISTYEGYVDSDIFYYPKDTDVDSPAKTWWGQLSGLTGLRLLSDASVGGATVCGNPQDPTGKCFTSDARIRKLAGPRGVSPDIIFVEGGINDFAQNRPVRPDAFQQAVISFGDPEGPDNIIVFSDAYDLLLTKLQSAYPNSEIIAFTCTEIITYTDETHTKWFAPTNVFGASIRDFNDVIRETAAAHGIRVIDVHGCGITPENGALLTTADGVHPNATGCMLMAQTIAAGLLN